MYFGRIDGHETEQGSKEGGVTNSPVAVLSMTVHEKRHECNER